MTKNKKSNLSPGDEVIITRKGKFLTEGVIESLWDNDDGSFKKHDYGLRIYCMNSFSYGNKKYIWNVNKGLYVFIIDELGFFKAKAKSWSRLGSCKIERKKK